MATELPHPNSAWLDVTIQQYIESSVQKWQRFVQEALPSAVVTICDGLLFHGNMTDLLLMNKDFHDWSRSIRRIVRFVMASSRSLRCPSCPFAIVANGPRTISKSSRFSNCLQHHQQFFPGSSERMFATFSQGLPIVSELHCETSSAPAPIQRFHALTDPGDHDRQMLKHLFSYGCR